MPVVRAVFPAVWAVIGQAYSAVRARDPGASVRVCVRSWKLELDFWRGID